MIATRIDDAAEPAGAASGQPRMSGVLAGLRAALAAAGHPAADAALTPLRDKGLAHDHVRLGTTGLLARIPKQSQLDLPPEAALAHEAACFTRAAAGAASPRLHGWLPVSAQLPRGALLVDEVAGRAARLPGDLPALARALAALHALPVPPAGARPPLGHAADPLAQLHADIARQWARARPGQLAPAAARALDEGLSALARHVQQPARPPVCLIAFDAHPGNFLVDGRGQAWLVDLEKCRYAPPGLDLAHATLYTSTTWDLETQAVLQVDDVLAFHAAWAGAVDAPLAEAARAWHAPLRHAMWLWSLSWCAQWLAVSGAAPRGAGEDWSVAHSDAALVGHVRERVHHYLSPAAVARVQRELDTLERAWRA